MRPERIIISAFGPFADKTEIDFNVLGEKGLYLVCGDTGAGKTTIFDAISFALFGEVSSSAQGAREKQTLRSNYADPTAETYVELWFNYRGQTYRIKRNPSYVRQAKRKTAGSDGTTTQIAKVEMEYPDGQTLSKEGQVRTAVEKLLGIDRNQFTQIVMIAQGEFRKLLTSKTKDRAEIFRKLFDTRMYEQFQSELAIKASQLEKQYAETQRTVTWIAQQADFAEDGQKEQEVQRRVSNGDALGEWLEGQLVEQLAQDASIHEAHALRQRQANDALAHQKAIIEAAQSWENTRLIKAQAQAQAEQLTKQVEPAKAALEEQLALEPKQHQIEEQINEINVSMPLYQRLQKAQEDLQAACAREDSCTEKAERAADAKRAAANQLEQLEQSITPLLRADAENAMARATVEQAQTAMTSAQELAERFAKAEHDRKAWVAAQAKASESQEKLAKQEAQAAAAQEKLAHASAEVETLSDAGLELEKAKNALERAAAEESSVNALVTEREALNSAVAASQQASVDADARYEQARANYDAAAGKPAQLRLLQMDDVAGILSSRLDEGDACPVCGSTHHVKLAQRPHYVPSDEEVSKAEAQATKLQKTLEAASTQAAQARLALSRDEDALAGHISRHGDNEQLQQKVHCAHQETEKADSQLQKAHERVGQHKSAQQALEAAKNDADRTSKQLKEAQAATEQCKTEASAAKATYETQIELLPECTIEQARQEQLDAQAAYQEALRAQQLAEANLEKLSELTVQKKQAEAELTQINQDIENLSRSAVEISSAKSAADAQINQITNSLRFPTLQQARETLSNLQAEAQRLITARQKAQAAHQNLLAQIDKCQTAIQTCDEALKDAQEIDVQAEKEKLAALAADAEMANNQLTHVASRINANQRSLESLRQALSKGAGISKEYGEVKQLADIANGKVSGSSKVSFETYIQSIYFDRIIAAANQRYKTLTSGRYELQRHVESGTSQGQSGLNLDVFDYTTGMARDASSLSGGESFQASLCLALGLSDVVQMCAGGIKLDTMFIDEGFGSLDQQSLSNAINMLADLSTGNKLIGIISHVEELKANIDRKVIVTRTDKGSSVAIEV